jgi:hypothetical protein
MLVRSSSLARRAAAAVAPRRLHATTPHVSALDFDVGCGIEQATCWRGFVPSQLAEARASEARGP